MKTNITRLRVLRFWNRVGLGAAGLGLALLLLRQVTTPTGANATRAFEVVGTILIVIFVFSLLRVLLFRCPRCGKFFSLTFRPYNKTTGRLCTHCGLRGNADLD